MQEICCDFTEGFRKVLVLMVQALFAIPSVMEDVVKSALQKTVKSAVEKGTEYASDAVRTNVSAAKADAYATKTDAYVARDDINSRAERIMEDYGNMILRMAYSYLHNMSDAEEILQETLIKFLQTAPDFDSREHEKAWLLHVTVNLSKNRIKYNSYRSTDELNEELVAEEREDLSFVWEAVKELPEKFREVIHLFYYEGLSTKQISEALKRKESTVRSDLRRGREQLKLVLKEGYDFEE